MKLGIFGDLHIDNKGPDRRLDNFWESACRKFTQGLEIFRSNNCDCIVSPGDLVEHPGVSYAVTSKIINMINSSKYLLLMVFGQHDISGHSEATLTTSPLSVLKASGVIELLNDGPYIPAGVVDKINDNVMIYGAGFGQEIPKPLNTKDYNILVIHAMISDISLYPGHEFTQAQQFLKQNPDYKLVICGDVHRRFICTYGDRTIINAGPLMRDTIDKHILEHRPAVVIFDTDTNKAEVIELTFKPVEKVFDMTVTVKRDNTLLNKFIERLKTGVKSTMSSWKQVLANVLKEKCTSEGGKLIIDKALEGINTK